MEANAEGARGKRAYWKGDLAEYTGRVLGGEWYELVLLEGHRKGDKIVTLYSPSRNPALVTEPA